MKDATAWILDPARNIDTDALVRAEQRQQTLTKPPGSLGELERIAIRLCGMQGDRPHVDSPAIVVFAADHGVVAEGVSAFPQVVTGEMVRNFAAGGAAISVLARTQSARLEVVLLGAVNDPGELPGVVREWIAPESANLAREAAMSDAELSVALAAGRRAVERAPGADLLLPGDMGIGNTTAAAAMSCALLGRDAVEIAGPGTGLDVEGVRHKADVIEAALERHRELLDQPLEVLRRLGGFEIAAMTGAFVAAAQKGLPVLVDGFIASAAALAAIRLSPGVANWMFLSHRSAEPGHAPLVEALSAATGSRPLLDLGMRLGEGSGAAVALPLLRLACAIHNDMATFAEAGVSGAD